MRAVKCYGFVRGDILMRSGDGSYNVNSIKTDMRETPIIIRSADEDIARSEALRVLAHWIEIHRPRFLEVDDKGERRMPVPLDNQYEAALKVAEEA